MAAHMELCVRPLSNFMRQKQKLSVLKFWILKLGWEKFEKLEKYRSGACNKNGI